MARRRATYWIGADHHKRNTFLTTRDPQGEIVGRANLPATTDSLTEFFREHPRPFVVGIEATYAWEYVADIVEGLGEEIRVGHAVLLKAFAKRHKKNDKIDSGLISHLLWRGDFPAIAHPPKAAREKRDLYRQRMDLVRKRSSVSSRAKALADRLGFQATMNLSTYKGIRELAALPVSGSYGEVLKSHAATLEFLTREIKRLEGLIDAVAEASMETRLLATIPGIAGYLALLIGSEVFDINRFATSRRFAAYSGVAPGSFSSGGKVFRGHLCPNANKYLRWALGEAAIHYIGACPWAKNKYERLKRAKGWKTARMAIARHVAIVVYHVLKERRAYRAAV